MSTQNTPSSDYLVLARKYRPQSFADMIGQEALVQTLTNAIESKRIHHAFIFNGIRGTGKTTTARIMAMALNCENGPAAAWDENDPQVKAIIEGRHADVLEFDAASHTKTEDIQELFEGVAYQPVQGRYKVYIIDEVHMLSRHAFNALLKTLEEPPANVKFIFATTEVNKIPVTVLSRCQRFDLKRIPSPVLADYFMKLLAKENVEAEEAAVHAIARAADGSVRDGLSLLDQAIALSGHAKVSAETVAQMLGQADRSHIFKLLESVLTGKGAEALTLFQQMYSGGHDPLQILTDCQHLLHTMTRIKLVPDLVQGHLLSEMEKTYAVPLAEAMSLEGLSRAYQMSLTVMEEAKFGSRPEEIVEMGLVRMAYLAPLPSVETLMSRLTGDMGSLTGEPPAKKPLATARTQAVNTAETRSVVSNDGAEGATVAVVENTSPEAASVQNVFQATPSQEAPLVTGSVPQRTPPAAEAPASVSMSETEQEDVLTSAPVFEAALPAYEQAREDFHAEGDENAVSFALATAAENAAECSEKETWQTLIERVRVESPSLAAQLTQNARCVAIVGTEITLQVDDKLLSAQETAQRLRDLLKLFTGDIWQVLLVKEAQGITTVAEDREEARKERVARALKDDAVQELLAVYPGSEIIDVQPLNEGEERA